MPIKGLNLHLPGRRCNCSFKKRRKNAAIRTTNRYISETIEDAQLVTMEDQQEATHGLSIGSNFHNLQRPQRAISPDIVFPGLVSLCGSELPAANRWLPRPPEVPCLQPN